VKKPDIQQVYQAGSYLTCVFLALQITSGLEGTEFSGGWLTGPLLSMEDTLSNVISLEQSSRSVRLKPAADSAKAKNPTLARKAAFSRLFETPASTALSTRQ
jgi:hypothetical protein